MLPRGGLRESPNMDYSACNSCQRTEGRLILSCPSLRALLCLWKRPRAPRRKLVESLEGVLLLHTLSFFFRWKRVPVCNLCNLSWEDNPSLSFFFLGGAGVVILFFILWGFFFSFIFSWVFFFCPEALTPTTASVACTYSTLSPEKAAECLVLVLHFVSLYVHTGRFVCVCVPVHRCSFHLPLPVAVKQGKSVSVSVN